MPTTRTAKRPIITTAKPNTQGRTAQGSATSPGPTACSDRVPFLPATRTSSFDTHDIAAKFDSSSNNVHTQLADCVGAGLLTRERDDELAYIYTAGPRLATSPYAALAEAAATDTSGFAGAACSKPPPFWLQPWPKPSPPGAAPPRAPRPRHAATAPT